MGHSDPHGAQQARNAGDGKKVTPPEEMVRVIISNTEQGVFTGNMDYLRALIAAYKAEKATVITLGGATAGLLKRAEDAEEQVRNLQEENRKLAQLVPDNLTPAAVTETVDASEPGLVPAEQAQDSIGS